MAAQDVNKEAGAEATFKKIGEAYEVGAKLPVRAVARVVGVRCPLICPPLPAPPQVLSDDQKRTIYDRYGEAGLKGGMGGFSGMGGSGVEFQNPFDLFESFFGGGLGGFGRAGMSSRNRPQAGEDER